MDNGIAIIGIGCRFPGGADGPEAFWRLLEKGFDAITEAPEGRPGFGQLFDPDPKAPGRTYSRWGGFLDNVDQFDAQFFGISPREALHIDPQQRMLLELVWEAAEDAGLPPAKLAGTRTGVFVGISTHDYGDLQMYPQHRADIDMHTNSGTATSIAANRISYLYDLRGPSAAVDTACSSALTAVHFACQSLLHGDCGIAIAGGVQLMLTPEVTIGFSKASMLSKDGKCRAFDAAANGYVRSEGAGVVLLRPLKDALAAGDPIYAVIRATNINQDGRTNGMTVPSAAAQQAMIEEALAKAGIAARDVGYVEAHGTGTPVGDPIEASAIGAAVGRGRREGDRCLIGSVKTNIGHLEAASGMAGLIKVALSLQHRRIPPSLHFEHAGAGIDLDGLNLRVVTEPEPWPESNHKAIAGVNSFGFGGANAHVILEAAPQTDRAFAAEPEIPRLLVLSAKSPEALRSLARSYAKSVRADNAALRDVCWTAGGRRSHHDFRLSVVATQREDFSTTLLDFVDGGSGVNLVSGRAANQGAPPLAFVFSGMGPQWWGMGRQLRATEPVFRQAMERCDAALRPHSGWSLLEEFAAGEATSRVALPEFAQVTNFAIQVALAELWASYGIRPGAVIGHSGGAMAAAYIAGIYDLEDAIRLTFHRSRLQGRQSNEGRMLAVGAPFAEIAPLLQGVGHLVSLAAVNGPSAITLAGDGDTLERIRETLQQKQIFARLLTVTIAYHSPAMDKIREEFLAAVPGLKGRTATIPFVSDTLGAWADGKECDTEYWWRAIRQPVLFRDGIRAILGAGISDFVEVSPHPVLVSSILECMKEFGAKGLAVPSLRRAEDERLVMLRSLGTLYTVGCTPDWSALREESARVTALPHYAWQRERHWFEPASHGLPNAGTRQKTDHPLLGSRLRSARPAWENEVGTGVTEFLLDHVVQGSPVCPGAAYAEMAIAAQILLSGKPCAGLNNVEFLRPLVLHREGATPIQFALDAETGSFEVFSAPSPDAASWVCHSRGFAVTLAEGDAPRVDLTELRSRINETVSRQEFYARMADRGLAYGPVFQGIESLRATKGTNTTGRYQGEALARIGLAELAGGYQLHPALLDSAFQVLVAAADTDPDLRGQRRLFLPVKLREVRFHRSQAKQFWSVARLTEVTEASVTGDILLADEEGAVFAEFRGLTARLVDAGAPGRQESVDQWLYEYRWEEQSAQGPRPGAGIRVPIGAELESILTHADNIAANTGWSQYYGRIENRLNQLAAAWVAQSLDLPKEPGIRLVPEALAAPGWRTSLVTQLLELLEREGLVRRTANIWETVGRQLAADAETLAECLLQDFPAHRLDVELLGRCGPRLADVLAGRADGTDVLFSDEGFAFLQRFYRDSPASAFYNSLAADTAIALGARGPLRILEVGAGTGGTTAHILPRLAGTSARYTFTDVSPVFLERAQAQFSEFPFLTTRLLDVTKDPAGQGFEPASFDLIIAANVLHATPDVAASVTRLHGLLAPGGALLLLEITSHPYWLDIAFGLTGGWWKFEDRQRRPNHPLMRGGQWRRLLEECGMERSTVIADHLLHIQGEESVEPAQSIVIATRSPKIPAASPGRWLLFADQRGVARQLAAQLEAEGCSCQLVYEPEEDFVLEADELATLQGIVYLRALDLPAFHTEPASACTGALTILQRLLKDSPLADRQFVLVTAGAQSAGSDLGSVAPLQSALWGFGRVIRKEWPGLRCRMADMSTACNSEETSSLADELLRDDGKSDTWEEELAFRGKTRFVHRLRHTTLAGLADAAPALNAGPEDGWRAESPVEGSLSSIVFRQTARGELQPLEVEIAIAAAGLNFRDVVLATGAVAGLESENSFGGKRLGFDLAGIVTRCGSSVEHLKPGDHVLGIAPGSFASHASTDSRLVTRYPSSIGFDQASTVPVAFVTAHYALTHLARLAAGESVLIHAASGGVGLAAIQLARLAGARVFATAGSPEKRAYLESLGIPHIMDSRALTFADEVRQLTGGRGVDVVLNSLAGPAMERGIAALAPYGRFVELGKSDIYRNQRMDLGPFRKNLSLFAVDLDRMCYERTEFVGGMLREVIGLFTSGALTPLPHTTFDMKDLTSAMRFMAQAKHIGKVTLRNGAAVEIRPCLPERPPVRSDGTYLITGGMGGVGLLVARWLVGQGARCLVLVGRNAPSFETEAHLEDLRESGARIEAIAADVCSQTDVDRVIDFIRAALPPLRGILHAAMVLKDTALADLDAGGLARVMNPKIRGAWNLHLATQHDPLDFFVSFSSITSLLGNPRQANYAAANSFLDAFASYRRALGLPATTINWGVIAGSGYVARHAEVEEYLNKQGYQSFSEEQALEVLAQLLRHSPGSVMAARIDWQRLGEFGPRAAASPRISHLVPSPRSSSRNSAQGSIRSLLESDAPENRIARLETYLREQVARLLGASASAIDIARPVSEFGLDSLIATELTVVLQRDLGIEIAGTLLLGGVTVRGLATEVSRMLHIETPAETPPETPPAPAPVAVHIPAAEPAAPIPDSIPAASPQPSTSAGRVPAPPVVLPLADRAGLDMDSAPPIDYRALEYSNWTRAQQAIRLAMAAGVHLLGRVQTDGLENLPRTGGCLLAVNHLSMADGPLLLSLLPRRAILLANERLRQNRAMDWLISDMGQAIYVTPNQAEHSNDDALQQALTVLRSGGLLALSPEGTRSKTGVLLRGKTGVAWLATMAGVPVVPLAAWGQEKWRERAASLRRIPIHVRIGKPVRLPAGAASPAELRQYTDQIMKDIAGMLPPEYRGVYGAEVRAS